MRQIHGSLPFRWGYVVALAVLCSACGGGPAGFTLEKNPGDRDERPYPFDDPVFIDVFQSLDGRYPIYRIPALITTREGTLLAFAEGRQSTNDHSENDMVMRRSTDGGLTWGPLIVIAEEGTDCLSDPLPVQISLGPNAGRILFFYTRFPEGCHHGCVEPGYGGPRNSRSYMLTSDDDGLSWQGPVELTRVFRPEHLRYVSGGPGFAIQKRLDPHAGRIVLPFRQEGPMRVLAIYSDDGGETWQRGEAADDSRIEGSANEVQMAELPDGSLYLNARRQPGNNLRGVARSRDGGETWSPLMDDDELPEPKCMAGILQFSGVGDGQLPRLLYSGPDNPSARVSGEIKLSYDHGETWPVRKVIWPGIFAYSVPTRIDCRTAGVLYEDNIWFHRLRLARFSIEWLTDGMDRPACH
jgi:sialidase-1